ncbi:MAG TPA: oxidoreductase, partial [Acidimicrobiales bacterium]|nr:oxidoreductase [Acidimicrobiales bacterium]
VYPFIVRGAALLGVDTVQTPVEVRRSVWASLAGALPTGLVDRMVEGEVGLDGVPQALESVLAGRVRGRVLVRPSA